MEQIVFFETEEWEEPKLQQSLTGHTVSFIHDKLTQETVGQIQDATIISTFIYSTLTADVLSHLPQLKLITTRSTGYDHIDVAYCKEKNITVCNVPSYGAHTVAEHTFALILALSRKLIPSIEQARRGDFRLDGLRGFDLFDKTLGIIGAGTIGKTVMQIARGFGMQVIIFTRTPDKSLEQDGVRFVETLTDLLSQADIITLHVPENNETHHMINRENISSCKKGSLLINTARGGLIETQAILEGLDKGIFAGVGIDVVEEEHSLKEERELLTSDFLQKTNLQTLLLDHILLTRANVLLTPHNAFNSTEALAQILEITGENIHSFINGTPQNRVTSS